MPVFSASATPSPVLSSTLSKSRISQSLDCPTGRGSTMGQNGVRVEAVGVLDRKARAREHTLERAHHVKMRNVGRLMLLDKNQPQFRHRISLPPGSLRRRRCSACGNPASSRPHSSARAHASNTPVQRRRRSCSTAEFHPRCGGGWRKCGSRPHSSKASIQRFRSK